MSYSCGAVCDVLWGVYQRRSLFKAFQCKRLTAKTCTALCCLLVFWSPVADAVEKTVNNPLVIDWSATNQQVLSQHILPLYNQLAQTSLALRELIHNDCAQQKRMVATVPLSWQNAFAQFWQAWAAVQHIRLGPISYQQRYARIHYWPDKHNRGTRQLKRLLTQDLTHLDAAAFAHKSVALQGISALEKVLYSFNAEQLNQQLCHIASLISANLATIAVDNLTAWRQGPNAFQQTFFQFSQPDSVFASNKVLSTRLLNDLNTHLSSIKDLKLLRTLVFIKQPSALPLALPESIAKSKPKRLEAWRSRQSLALLKANLLAGQSLYQLGFEPHVRKVNSLLHRQIASAFQRSLAAVDAFEQPLYDCLLVQPCSSLTALVEQVSVLQALVAEDMRHYLGLQYSFNSLDGD